MVDSSVPEWVDSPSKDKVRMRMRLLVRRRLTWALGSLLRGCGFGLGCPRHFGGPFLWLLGGPLLVGIVRSSVSEAGPDDVVQLDRHPFSITLIVLRRIVIRSIDMSVLFSDHLDDVIVCDVLCHAAATV